MGSGWMRQAILLLGLTILAALGGCGPRETLLAVHASAKIRSTPDLAIVTLGVTARGDTASAAQQAQSARMQEVLAVAKAAGVQDADVQTVNFSLDRQYVYPRGVPPRVSGYLSRNLVEIRLHDLNAISGMIDAVVAEGANELQGIAFTFANEEASREAARGEALNTARKRAQVYAKAAGLRVVRIQSIIEPGASLPSPDPSRGFAGVLVEAAAPTATAAQIQPGQLDNVASVSVVFVLR